MYQKICDKIFTPCISKLDSPDSIYLTFDDGPDPITTPLVLDILLKHDAKATFFVVVKKATVYSKILKRILAEGHAVGNHSFDHAYRMFFQNEKKLKERIVLSQSALKKLIQSDPVGFRSPAGVRTPKLHRVLDELAIPLIHWSERFYDTKVGWKIEKALVAARQMTAGSIVLLHDAQGPKRRAQFLNTLDIFIQQLKSQGYVLDRL